MRPQANRSDKEPYDIFTDEEEAKRLVMGARDTDLDEPEPLVKLLLTIHDCAEEAKLKDFIYLLMRTAYRCSIVESIDLQEYLEAIRQDQNPAGSARARLDGSHNSEG